MTALKTCFKCGQQKPRSEFYAHPAMADGLLGKCKPCARKDVRANYAANAERYRAYDAKRSQEPERRARNIAAFRVARDMYPERWAAVKMAEQAVRRGDIARQPCWVCGERAEAHHPDYSRPLDVVWLCRIHHRQAHALVRVMDDNPKAA